MIAARSAATDRTQRILHSLGPLPASTDPPTLVLTAGLPGSGKSTFVRRLAPAIGATILESDALRRLLYERPQHGATESRRLFGAIYGATRRLLSAGVSVVIDATNLRESERLPAYEIAAATGARLAVLYFTAPEAVVTERLERRLADTERLDASTAGIEVYYRMADREEPPARRHWRIDTSDPEAVEAALRAVIAACRPKATTEEAGRG